MKHLSAGACRGVLSCDFARRYAAEWIAAWNSHDLERILAHYSDEFEMFSPLIVERAGEASGLLRGREKVGHLFEVRTRGKSANILEEWQSLNPATLTTIVSRRC